MHVKTFTIPGSHVYQSFLPANWPQLRWAVCSVVCLPFASLSSPLKIAAICISLWRASLIPPSTAVPCWQQLGQQLGHQQQQQQQQLLLLHMLTPSAVNVLVAAGVAGKNTSHRCDMHSLAPTRSFRHTQHGVAVGSAFGSLSFRRDCMLSQHFPYVDCPLVLSWLSWLSWPNRLSIESAAGRGGCCSLPTTCGSEGFGGARLSLLCAAALPQISFPVR